MAETCQSPVSGETFLAIRIAGVGMIFISALLSEITLATSERFAGLVRHQTVPLCFSFDASYTRSKFPLYYLKLRTAPNSAACVPRFRSLVCAPHNR